MPHRPPSHHGSSNHVVWTIAVTIAAAVLINARSSSGDEYAAWVDDYTAVSNAGQTSDVLGPPDNVVAEFDGEPGYVTVGFSNWIVDEPGDDIGVHLWDFTTYGPVGMESFTLSASDDGTEFYDLGSATPADHSGAATAPYTIHFDLASSPLTQARYLRLTNDLIFDDGSASAPHEGPEIDAFSAINTAPATQQPIRFGGNGHYYELVTDRPATWTDAHQLASERSYSGLGGHLATVTSESENNFLKSLPAWDTAQELSPHVSGAYIGGTLRDDGWEWVTEETWAYENWNPGEPSGTGTPRLMFYSKRNPDAFGRWNDMTEVNDRSHLGYIVEYDYQANEPQPPPRDETPSGQTYYEFAYRRTISLGVEFDALTADLGLLHSLGVPIPADAQLADVSLPFDASVSIIAIDISGHFAVPKLLEPLASQIHIDEPWLENVESGSISLDAIAGAATTIQQGDERATLEFDAGYDAGLTVGVPLETSAHIVPGLTPIVDFLRLAGLDPQELKIGIPAVDDGVPLPFPRSFGVIAEFEEPYTGPLINEELSVGGTLVSAQTEFRSITQYFFDKVPEGQTPTSPRMDLNLAGDAFVLASVPFVTSSTGESIISGNQCTMTTGSPVWTSFLLEVADPVNVLAFDLEFTSDVGAEGFLSVYWDDEIIGTFDERIAPDGTVTQLLSLPETIGPGFYSLAFRLDPYTDIASSVLIDEVSTGFVTPEPSTATLLVVCVLAVIRRRRAAQDGQHKMESSRRSAVRRRAFSHGQ